MPAGLVLRQAAAKLLAAVIDKKTSLNGLLDNAGGHPSYLDFDGRDRALLRAILHTALRHRGQIAAKLDALLRDPLPAGARSLEHILHISAAQILYMDAPNHAALDLAVESAKRNPQTKRFAGLVNAVLRNLIRAEAASGPHGGACDVKNASGSAGGNKDFVPQWFWQMLKTDYGAAKAAAIIEAQICPPPLDITVKSDPQIWAEKLGGRVLLFGDIRLAAGKEAISEMPGFASGAWWVQNAAASLPARLMGDLRGKRIADLCAAPGGKTAQLALAGAEVTAVDMSSSRLRRLRENMARLKLKVQTWQGDLRQMAKSAGFAPFDAVLLDGPCSSTGTARRHPDILWTKTASDIVGLAELQADLLAASLALVKSGGVILFCNCSLAKCEGEDLIAEFLERHKDKARLLPFTKAEMRGLLVPNAADDETAVTMAESLRSEEGFLRTTPADLPDADRHMSGLDGFFAARLEKL